MNDSMLITGAVLALAVMVFLRATVYHRLRMEIFEISGARLSRCGAVNKVLCYWFIGCAGWVVFQLMRGRLL